MSPDKKKEIEDVKLIYEKYFQLHNCTTLFSFLKKYSRIDFLLTSGDTNILIEYKNRDISVTDYFTSVLEVSKYEAIVNGMQLFDCNGAYMVEFRECICVWFITDKTKEEKRDQIPMPVSDGSKILELKDIIHMQFKNADLVITKKDNSYKSVSVDLLMKLFEKKQIEMYGKLN